MPEPVQSTVTAWRADEFSRGSYSFIAPGGTGDDYDAMAEPVGSRLFFAGEATSRQYPATTTGAMVTGLRQAGLLDEMASKARFQSVRQRSKLHDDVKSETASNGGAMAVDDVAIKEENGHVKTELVELSQNGVKQEQT